MENLEIKNQLRDKELTIYMGKQLIDNWDKALGDYCKDFKVYKDSNDIVFASEEHRQAYINSFNNK